MTHPNSRVSTASIFSIHTFSRKHTPGRSYTTVLYRRKHDQAPFRRRTIPPLSLLRTLIAPAQVHNLDRLLPGRLQ